MVRAWSSVVAVRRPGGGGEPSRVRGLRGRQHRVDGHPAAAQEGAGVEGVAAVVAGADDQPDPATVDRTAASLQFGQGDGGQAASGPGHQHTSGQQLSGGLFGRPDLRGGVVAGHGYSTVTDFARFRGLSTS